jgi:hypothetical protein
MDSRFMALPCAALLLLAPSSAQTVGGGYEELHRLDGTAADAYFGDSVSSAGDVDGDGYDDILVGAPDSSATASHAGSAFIYSGRDKSLLYQWNGTGTYESFGDAVSGAGDVDGDGLGDVIIGASAADHGGNNSGSAFVYSGADGSLLYQWNGAVDHGAFGIDVSAAGDVDQDGYADVIVGASSAFGGLSLAGAAFVYSGADGSLLYRWDGAVSGDAFGASVSAAGDFNRDGFDDLLVGAYATGPFNSGTAYVYSGADGSLLFFRDGAPFGEYFGWSVSDAGDVTGDGYYDIIVGAKSSDPATGTNAGAAYVYSGIDGSLVYQWVGEAADDAFGSSVSGAGDIDRDGLADLIVGAFTDGAGYTWAGSVYVYSGADGTQLARWDGDALYMWLGCSVSDGGDINDDGHFDMLVGARQASPGGLHYAGSVFTYGLNTYLHPSSPSISAAAGGVLDLLLDFPEIVAWDEYKILISATGTGPVYYGVQIPLTLDSYARDSYNGIYPLPNYTDLHGTLDAAGDGAGDMTFPAGLPPAMIGRVFYLAAVANQPGSLPEISSAARTLTIIP